MASSQPAAKKPRTSKKESEQKQQLTIDEQETLAYDRKGQLEHILLRPDTYVGDISLKQEWNWVIDRDDAEARRVQVKMSPAYFKIVDELLVNAADNKQRHPATTSLVQMKVWPETGEHMVWNNGVSIPPFKHVKHGIYVPEMIFGSLLSGSNFDDSQERTTGGRNGYGAKLANIFARYFILELSYRGTKYTQRFENNMTVTHPPEVVEPEVPVHTRLAGLTKKQQEKLVEQLHATDYVCIRFMPDYVRLNMPIPSASCPMDADLIGLLRRRVLDLAGTMTRFGGPKTPRLETKFEVVAAGTEAEEAPATRIASFRDYLLRYPCLVGENGSRLLFCERINERWEVAVAVNDESDLEATAAASAGGNSKGKADGFHQLSFVNSIHTSVGGTHVEYITDQVVDYIRDVLCPKKKIDRLKPAAIKSYLTICVNAVIVNPKFDTQTKTRLTSEVNEFGSECKLVPGQNPKTLDRLMSSELLISQLSRRSNFASDRQLAKALSGTKKKHVTGIEKLRDATFAGGPKSMQCILCLTEGDSAYALTSSASNVVGNDIFGAFPMRGKTRNVRGAKKEEIMKNEELRSLVTILGLVFGKEYKTEADIKTLRYGHLMILTDQDHDGSHIKGLLINFLHCFWPSLLVYPNFLIDFQTPLKKCTLREGAGATGNDGRQLPKVVAFFSELEYQQWVDANEPETVAKYGVKYYKGLGTSTAQEACEYFSDMMTHQFFFVYHEDADDLIDLAFRNKRADDRKAWLSEERKSETIPVNIVDNQKFISLSDFINYPFREFSLANVTRSLPSLYDGLKPSQRKVLYGCLKRDLVREIKVAQLAGYVSEHSAYHHGEASLCSTIIGMAQDYMGANNINLLRPNGQFGTRLMGGKDAASARYIFTQLEPITRALFPKDDDPLLEYLLDDGQKVEPKYYVPIIPMVLVNGSSGIGTGWATDIPTFNPREVIACVYSYVYARHLAEGGELEKEEGAAALVASFDLKPWFRGFKGTMKELSPKRFATFGKIERIDDDFLRFRISELPVGTWTMDYKKQLEAWDIRNVSVSSSTSKDDGSVGGDGAGSAGRATAPKDLKFITEIVDKFTDFKAEFVIECSEDALYGSGYLDPGASEEELAVFFKLRTFVGLDNMYMFNKEGLVEKFASVESIVRRFCEERWALYIERKKHLLKKLAREVMIARNKARFIQLVASGQLEVRGRPRKDIERELKALRFDEESASAEAASADEEEEQTEAAAAASASYEYLLRMPLYSVTMEKVKHWMDFKTQRELDYAMLEKKPVADLWIADLKKLEGALASFEKNRESKIAEIEKFAAKYKREKEGGGGGKKGGGSAGKKRATKKRSLEEE